MKGQPVGQDITDICSRSYNCRQDPHPRMGVRGLSSYLAPRRELFDTTELRDTKVIIDGNNLRFSLYRSCPGLNDCFGGDYDKFRGFVLRFFRLLLRCRVTPVIILDGGLDKTGQKLPTVRNISVMSAMIYNVIN